MANDLIVFLHDLGQTPQTWQQQVVALPAGLPAAAPWLHGTRPGGQRTFNLPGAVAELSSVLLQHGADRAYLVAHGVAALVAVHAAVEDPRIAGLVLSSPPKRPNPFERAVIRFAARRTGHDLDLHWPEGAKVTAPTLIIAPGGDRMATQGADAAAAEIPGARLEIVDTAGPAFEEAAVFNPLLVDFLAQLRAPATD